jgi:hypothetical protein
MILFLGENVRPRYDLFDYSLSFDLSSYGGRNIHCPLWMLEVDWFCRARYPDRVTYPLRLLTDSKAADYRHRRDSAIFVGNNAEPLRRYMITALRNNNISVDEYGSHTNPIKDKISLLKEYKIAICPENSFHPGYVTEKLVHPYIAGSHMLYWGGADYLGINSHNQVISIRPDFNEDELVRSARSILAKSETCQIEPLIPQLVAERHFKRLVDGCLRILRLYDSTLRRITT